MAGRLRSALANVTRDRCQIVHRTGDHSSVFGRVAQEVGHALTSGVRTHQRGVRQFSLRRVFAGGLAELLRCLLLIEKVVDDLKRQADRLSESAKRVELDIGGVAEESAEEDAGGDQLACLVRVDEFELLKCGSGRLARWAAE